ncbi:MAG: DMT family transporter [Eubacteriales bacterium]|nr:DMT family transporter [Eubacteriales bacterium]
MKQIKGSLACLLAAVIWGAAFVTQVVIVNNGVGTFSFVFFRSFIAFLFLFVLLQISRIFHLDKDYEKYKNKKEIKHILLAGFSCGILVFTSTALQQAGMAMYPSGTAVSGRAGFITATYVVMASIVQTLLGRRPHILVIISALICMIGVYYMSFSNGIDNIYIGDIFIFLCAIVYTIHIFTIDYFNDIDSVRLCMMQFLFSSIFTFPLMIFEGININGIIKSILPFLYMGVMSSGIAYTLQMYGQKRTSPAIAAIILSLESVFAALSGFIFINEKLLQREIIGASLMFFAVILAQVPLLIKKK